MCVGIILLIIECIWFMHRFKSGKFEIPPEIQANSAANQPLAELTAQPSHSPRYIFQKPAFQFQAQNRAQQIWSTGSHYNFMFPSFLHFKRVPPPHATTALTDSSTPITLPKPTKISSSKRPVLLQAISEPHQRTNLSDTDTSPIEVNIAPLQIGHKGLITNAQLAYPEIGDPEFAISAPLAEEEETAYLGSELKKAEREPSCVREHARPQNIVAYSPPLVLDAKKWKNELAIDASPIMKKENDKKAASGSAHDSKFTKKDKKIKKSHQKLKTYEGRLGVRALLVVVCRLLFFLCHALFALLLVVADVGLYQLMSYYHNKNLEEIQRSDSLLCSTPSYEYQSSKTLTSYSSSSAELFSQSDTKCHSLHPPPVISGGLEVQVIGREVKVPFEMHLQTRGCLSAPGAPASTPFVVGIVVLSYAVIFLGILCMQLNIMYLLFNLN